MYVWIYIKKFCRCFYPNDSCKYVCSYVCKYVYICKPVCMLVCMSTSRYVCMFAFKYECMYECKSECIYACMMHGRLYVCMYASIYDHLNKIFYLFWHCNSEHNIVFALMTCLKRKLTNTLEELFLANRLFRKYSISSTDQFERNTH